MFEPFGSSFTRKALVVTMMPFRLLVSPLNNPGTFVAVSGKFGDAVPPTT